MRRLGWLALAVAAWSCSASSAWALTTRCFEPLADFADRDPKNFSQVATPTTATPATGVKRFEVIGSGVGDANIDFLYITFSAPSGVAPADFFKTMRQNFSVFAAGTTHQFAFGAYDPTSTILVNEMKADPHAAHFDYIWKLLLKHPL